MASCIWVIFNKPEWQHRRDIIDFHVLKHLRHHHCFLLHHCCDLIVQWKLCEDDTEIIYSFSSNWGYEQLQNLFLTFVKTFNLVVKDEDYSVNVICHLFYKTHDILNLILIIIISSLERKLHVDYFELIIMTNWTFILTGYNILLVISQNIS